MSRATLRMSIGVYVVSMLRALLGFARGIRGLFYFQLTSQSRRNLKIMSNFCYLKSY